MRGVFDAHVQSFGVCLNFTFLFRSVLDSHVNSFGVCSNTTCTYSEWSRPAKLAQGVALLQVGGDEVSAEGETKSASAMRHSLREAGALQAA